MQDEQQVELIPQDERGGGLEDQVAGQQDDRDAPGIRKQVRQGEEDVLAAVRNGEAADLVRYGSAVDADREDSRPSLARMLRDIVDVRLARLQHRSPASPFGKAHRK